MRTPAEDGVEGLGDGAGGAERVCGGGQYIFRMFGITLPAFEIAGGVILLLIGLDMLEAKRSPTQESHEEAAEAA